MLIQLELIFEIDNQIHYNMILRKTELHITYFWDGTPFRAISTNTKAIFEVDHKKLVFTFNFPSFKTNLDFNQDGEEIIKYLDKFTTIEFNDEFAIANVKKIQIDSKFKKIDFEIILNHPNEQIHVYKNVQFSIEDSKMTFRINN